MNVLNRFLNYVKFETMSNSESSTTPSSTNQLEFANYLVNELKQLGLSDVELDEFGYVTATLKGNIEKKVKTVGFIAHMDTSDAMTGFNVKPQIVKYVGEDIILNKENNIKLSPAEFPELNNYINQEIITTDGTTLLGADDKAGIAEIMGAIEYLINNPEIKHGDVKIAFTPDEEIGRGADHFNVKKFNADFAYTIDGGAIGELQYENFNAASATIKINGKSVHPGEAKNKMINALSVAVEIASLFPQHEVPEKTSGYEGFYHLTTLRGSVESATMHYIIRDFEKVTFNNRKEKVKEIINAINKKFGENTVVLELKDQYYNMREKIENHMYIVDIAKQAMEDLNIKPNIIPIRGGTDGSSLSYKGLLTPNIFTGGHNFHGKYEYIPVKSMELAAKLIVQIAHNISKL